MTTQRPINQKRHYLALSGGIGGAKLVLGLSHLLQENLYVVANTGDDFIHWGLHISPDLDTVMYTLAGLNNADMGWGLADESWNCLAAMKQLNQDSWFQLGDRDLATHLTRSHLLAEGHSLSAVMDILRRQFAIKSRLIPMSDDPVRTQVNLKNGQTLPFQQYFVREKCIPEVRSFSFIGSATATPSVAFLEALHDPALAGIIVCPSNPFVSIDPILSLPGLIQELKNSPAPVIAVSPIVAGQALKGPSAKIMQELGWPQTATRVAQHYATFIDGFILDQQDAALQSAIEQEVCKVQVAQTVMKSLDDRIHLAKICLDFAQTLLRTKDTP